MKITILEPLGDVGIITEVKPFISEAIITVNVIGKQEGTLTIGQKSYLIQNGIAKIPEYEILTRESKVSITTKDTTYNCGSITRKGRFLEVDNSVDKLIISCALKVSAQADEINKLKEDIDTVRHQFGIDLI